jgi:hypothetical protein
MPILDNDVANAVQAHYRATAAHKRLVREVTTSASARGSAFGAYSRVTGWLRGLRAQCLAPGLSREIAILPAEHPGI